MIPFSSTQTFKGREIRLVTDTVEHNVDLPADRFELPDDVKELVKKIEAAKAEAQKQAEEAPPETPAEEPEN
jgi:hypothetical protein